MRRSDGAAASTWRRVLSASVLAALIGAALVPFGFAAPAAAAAGDISGTVFNDYNHDGLQTAASGSGAAAILADPGVAGVWVRAYDSAGAAVGSAVQTSATGTYTLALGASAGTAVRIEFETPTGYEPSRAPLASMTTSNNSSVRFTTIPAGTTTGVNYAIEQPGDYCQANPTLCSTLFPWDTPTASDLAVTGLIEMAYPETVNDTTPAPTIAALGTATGPIYGVAYDSVTSTTFASTFLHRKSPFESTISGVTDETAVIFKDTSASTTPTVWANLNTLFPANLPGGANPHPNATTTWINDTATPPLVGKRALGDLDISNDGLWLYAVGLNDKAIYRIPSTVTPTAANIGRFPLDLSTVSDAQCPDADIRPFGLGVNAAGTIYVGAVCSGETGLVAANLRYYVWTMTTAGAFTLVLNLPVVNGVLDVDKGAAVTNQPRWNPWDFKNAWTDVNRDYANNESGNEIHPQPMLTDIGFIGNDMILGVRDRYGDQVPGQGRQATADPYAHGQGDVVRACWNGSAYIMEGNGVAGCDSGTDGEWFANDVPSDQWPESALGALTILASEPGVVTTAYDPRAYATTASTTPATNIFNEVGIANLQKTNTTVSNAHLGGYSAFLDNSTASDQWGKTNSLGDLEAICDSAPLEIGNRVWNDTDRDGIQDAGEAGIAGVTVGLYNAAGTGAALGTAVTNSNGEYYFSTDTARNATAGDNIGAGLAFRTGYTLRFGTAANYGAGQPLNGLAMSLANQTVTETFTGRSDTLDSDAALVDTDGGGSGTNTLGSDIFPVITVASTSTNPGENDHTYDVGFNVPIVYTPVDLALTKVVTSRAGNPGSGGTVTFTISVINQGSASVNPVVVTDYINTAHFNALASTQAVTTSLGAATWSSGATPSVTLPAALAAGATATIPITLTVATLGATNPTALTNRAEITSFDTDNNAGNGNSANGLVYDVDSVADNNAANDGTEKDDVVNEARYVNTGGVTGSPSATLDEDDADIASVPLIAADLALRKVVTSQSGVLGSGGTVTFTITVFNQGSVSVNPVVVTDYINTAHFNALASTQAVTTSLGAATWSTGSTPTITLPAALAAGASATIPITLTVANLGATNPAALTNRAEISAFDTDNTASNGNSANGWVYDVDSVADATPGNEGNEKDDFITETRYANTAGTTGTPSATLDEDDADIASVPLTGVDLALTKVVTSRTGSLFSGGTVTFTISVINQGAVSVNPVVVTDYINTAHFGALASTQAVTTSLGAATWSAGATPSITLPAALAAGATATIPITLTVAALGATNPTALTNRAEISAFDTDNTASNGNSADGTVFDVDSVADATPGNEGTEKDDVVNEARYANTAGTTGTPSATLDEDDADIASVPLIAVDLALRKVVTSQSGNVSLGTGTVTFTITVTNQGSVSVNPVVVTDYINTAHFNALASTQLVAISGGPSNATWSAGANPTITLPAALAPGASATIPITLTVANLGATNPAALTNRAEISSFDSDNNSANGNSSNGWVYDVDSVADATSSNDGNEKDDVINEARYVNTAGTNGTPSATLDEDDADIASVPLTGVDLALTKVVTSRSNLSSGSGTVTFTITVTNQGAVSVNPVVVTDYINTAHFNALASTQAVTTSLGAATWSAGATPTITLPAALAAGASATIPITLSVANLGASNPSALTNRAEISSFDTDNSAANGNSTDGTVYDVDSVADATPSNDGTEKDDVVNEARYVNTAGTTGTPSGSLDEDDADIASVPLTAVDLALRKVVTSRTGSVFSGGTVTFTITVFNQGAVSVNPVVVTDYINTAHFTALASTQAVTTSLGAATWSAGATPSITLPAALAAGASATIPITLTVATLGATNPAALTNRAEITSFDTDNLASNGNSADGAVYDVDSVADSNAANDGTEKDDFITEARYTNTGGVTGTPSGTLDEDDADIASVPLSAVDLALTKVVTSRSGSVYSGGTVTFTITVTNQGSVSVNPVVVTDYINTAHFNALASTQAVTTSLGAATWSSGATPAITLPAALAAGASATIPITLTVATLGATNPAALTNRAEISAFDTDNDSSNGNSSNGWVYDIDSIADATPGNEGTEKDDVINEARYVNTAGTNGTPSALLDEDDADIASVPLSAVDLALTKVVTSRSGTISSGGTVTFTITVTNQGSVSVNPVVVTDYINTAHFDALSSPQLVAISGGPSNATWSSGATPTITLPAALAAGASATIPITLTVANLGATNPAALTNRAEISAFDTDNTASNGNSSTGWVYDIDSVPDANAGNEGTEKDDVTNEARYANTAGTIGTPSATLDEDDADVASVPLTAVDLALTKVVTSRTAISSGSGSVTFTITVTNQGSVSVNPIVVTDYINTAHFTALASTQAVTTSLGAATWSSGATPAITLPAALAAGASATIPITLSVANLGSTNPSSLTNRAEITSFDNDNSAANGNSADGSVFDIDSVADATPSNDGNEKDDVVNEARYVNTAGTTGTPSATLDEDDADIASVPLSGVDLALTKTVTSRTGSLFSGGTVTFTITVINQGAVSVNPVVVTDYINTAHFNALTGTQAVTTSLGAATWSSGATPSITLPAALAAGASATIPITLNVASLGATNPTALTNRAEISAFDTDNTPGNGNSADGTVFDVDSVADSNAANDGTEKDDVVNEARYANTAGTTGTPSATLDEDDADIASVPLIAVDLGLRKVVTSRSGSVYSGGTVTFTITVTNQGSVSVNPVVVTDYINTAHFNALSGTQAVTTSQGSATWSSGATPSISLPAALAPGASATIPITLTVATLGATNPAALTNRAEISAFDTDNDSSNGNSSTGWVYDVDSIADATPSNEGTEKDDVTNEARYVNLAGANGSPSATLDEDDADIASVPLLAVDLALTKVYTSTGGLLVNGNGTVTFTITVINQGAVSVNPVVVTDYINTAQFTALASAQAVTTSLGAASWTSGSTPSITLPAALAAGASATIPITLAVAPGAVVNPLTAASLVNRAEISAFDTDNAASNGNSSTGWVYDVDSVPDTDSSNDGTEKDDVTNEARYVNTAGTIGTPSGTLDEDDADLATVPLYDLALIKDLASSETGYVQGPLPDSVGFDITVTNQGLNTNYNIRVQDRPEADMTLVPAANSSQSVTSSLSNTRTVTYGGSDYWDISQLLPNESVTFRVYVNAVTNGTSPYVNVAEITGFDNDANPVNAVPSYVQDVDSTPANNITPEDDQDNAQVIARPLVIGSTLFFDTDKDGDADVRAPGGILVQLLDNANTVIGSAITDAGGNYFFSGLAEGTYSVGVPTNQTGIGVNASALSGYISVPGTSATPSAANTLEGGSNDDGQPSSGWLTRSSTFTMTYEGHAGSDPIDLANAATYLATSVADETANLNIDFIFQPVPTYRVGNLVWLDTNNNGVVDGFEAGIDGVTVQLYTSANVLVGTTITAGGGHYEFDSLAAGDYYVQIPAIEFSSGGPLFGWRASSGAGVEADPDTNVDNNSNATQASPTALAKTANVTLGSLTDPLDASEPTNETDSDTWTDGNNRSNLSVDLGFYHLYRIGSTLFLDTDKDGDADTRAGGGILVQLLNAIGTVIDSAVTDPNGNYFFDNVTPSLYEVGIPTVQSGLGVNPTALAGYVSVPGFDPSPAATNTLEGDSDDDGNVAAGWLARSAGFLINYTGNGGNAPIDLANAALYLGTSVPDATANLRIDFIFQPAPTYRLGNLVWLDTNNNGVVDGAETGIDGVTVELYTSADVLVGSVLTSSGGHYEFGPLVAGDYYVQIPATDFASGGPLYGLSASSGAGFEADPDSNVDNNSNAIQVTSTTRAYTANVTLGSPSDPFDASEPINETDPDVWTDGNNRSNLSVDLGFHEPLRIGSTLFLDTDKDGDADLRAPAGIRVALLDNAGSVIATAITDAGGNYFFDGLTSGLYQVGVPVNQTGPGLDPFALSGYYSVPGASASPSAVNTMIGGSDDDGASDVGNGWRAITVPFPLNYGAHAGNDTEDLANALAYLGSARADANSDLNIDFIFQPVPTYRVGNLVWLDRNNNGIVDGAEAGIDGVTVELLTATDTLIGTTVTSGGGHYVFDTLAAGDYYVRIPTAEFISGGDLIGLRASTGAGVEADPDSDVDNNSNAIQSGPIADLTTGVFTLGSTTDPFDANEPTNETDSDTWTDGNNRSNLSVDLGLYEPLRIGSTLFFDTDEDAIADVRAPGGILVQLLNGAGAVIASAVTDAGGNYFFGQLAPGTYQVAIPTTQVGPGVNPTALSGYITVPGASASPKASNTMVGTAGDDGALDLGNGWRSITAQFTMSYTGNGSNDATDLSNAVIYLSTPVSDASANLNIDFIFQPVPTYRVGNLVWRDTNNNGLVDGPESGIDGVAVELYTSADVFVASTTTSGGGYYSFDSLAAGVYYVQIPATEFNGGALTGLRASTGAGIEANPDLDVDNNSNATQASPTALAKTGNFTLGSLTDPLDASEPTDETDSDTWSYGNDRSNLSVDLGFYEPLRLGSLVWNDNGFDGFGAVVLANDNNGVADFGEYGISGVDVELWLDVDLDGAFEPAGDDFTGLIATTTTNGTGSYLFDNLAAGSYFVAIPAGQGPLSPLRSSTPDTNGGSPEAADDDDDGISATSGYVVRSGVVVLAYGAEPSTETGDFGFGDSETTADTLAGSTKADSSSQLFVDFGFSPLPLYRIGNVVWRDYDNDGSLDAGEPGLSGITVELYEDNGSTPFVLDGTDSLVDTTTTDVDGRYGFDTLPGGNYLIHVPSQSALTDWRTAGTPVVNADGNVDNDNNALVDATDGWTSGRVVLGGAGGPADHDEPTGETDANTGNSAEDLLWRDDRSNQTVDFGFYAGLRLGNQVWLDEGAGTNRANGVFDADETGLTGITVQLWLDNGDNAFSASTDTLVTSTTTDGEGNYLFSHLDEGDYFVAVAVAGSPTMVSSPGTVGTGLSDDNVDDGAPTTGYLAVTGLLSLSVGSAPVAELDAAPLGDDFAEDEANLAGDDYRDEDSYLTADLGFTDVATYRIGNLVWADWDNDGQAETSEPGIAAVLVQLLDAADTVISETVTDSNGFYEFTGLVAGDYRIYIPLAQSGAGVDPAALAGFFSTAVTETVANADVDNDDNGVDNLVASTLDGWKSGLVTLGDNTSNEPVNETVRSDSATDDDAGQAIPRIDDDYSNYSVDFGFYSLSIGNHVWLDVVNNDVFDNGLDFPAVGVTVELRDAITNDLLQTTTTDADGLYLFIGLIDSMDYRVVIPAANFAPGGPLEGWYQTSGWATSHQTPDGRDGGIDAALYADVVSIDMEAVAGGMPLGENTTEDLVNDLVRPDGNTNLFVDFSFSNWTPTYRVGNTVWLDANNNGVIDATEPGIDGVTVSLYTAANAFVANTTTAGGGRYEFYSLAPGDYYVRIPASEFTAGALIGLRASTGAGVEADPDADVDSNSNAIQTTPTALAQTAVFTLGSPTDPFDASEPTNEDDADTWTDGNNRSNLSVDLGFYQPLRVGSLVWYDNGYDGVGSYTTANDDNGIADSGETGVSGLTVELWRDVNNDGLFEPGAGDADETGFVDDTVTNVDGSYLFGALAPGNYFIAIPAGQAPLAGWRSSSPDTNAGLPEASDDDDDGIVAPGYAGVTGQIVLDYVTEPTTETGDFGSGNSETLANALAGTTADENSQLFVDFGFSPMPSYRIANLVWQDYNDNGVADSGEPGLDGLTVELYRVGTVAAIASTTTSGGGRYEFAGLPTGDYRVHVPTQAALSGWRTAGTPNANADGNVDNDNNAVVDGATGWTSGVVTLGGTAGPADHAEPTGEVDGTDGASAEDGAERDDRSNETVDFGFFTGLRLGNQVWLDEGAGANLDNGIFDTDESGLAGVAVQLWLDNGNSAFSNANDTLVASTTTNAEGNYWFGHLEPGNYFVALPTFSGAISSTGTVGLGLGDDNVDDGAPTAGYVAVSGLLSLSIGAAVTGEADVSPAGDGSAESEADAATSSYRDIDSFLTADFGLTGAPLYRLGNRVWIDSNNDGVATSTEPGVSGVLVQLRDASNALVAETVTDAAGFYAFTGLVEGDYSVLIPRDQIVDGTLPIGSPAIVPTALNGFLSSTATVINANTDADNDDNGMDQFTGPALVGWSSGLLTLSGTASEPINETLRSNDATDDDLGQASPRIDDNRSNYTVDFGFYSISVGNHLWLDLANDGAYDAGSDLPAVGVTVELRDSVTNALITTATTDASGLYLLTGVPDDASYVVVIPGSNFDVGQPLEGWYPSNGSTSGFGIDGRDHGLNAAHFANVVSDVFSVNAGSMPLGENGVDDFVNDSVRPDANTNLYLDFSFYRMELGGVVFWDPTNNGHDDLDGYFPNVTVLLYNGDGTPFLRANGVQASTTTTAGGRYVFTGLPTGTYIVEIPSSEFSQELEDLGSSDGNNVSGNAPLADTDDLSADNGNPVNGNLFSGGAVRSSVVTLSIDTEPTADGAPTAGVPNADSNLSVDFGFWMVQSSLELGNQIWFDTDKDGIYDVGTELPAPAGVIIELHDGVTGALIATTTTNALGQYLFSGLDAGTYYLELPEINFVNGHPLSGYSATTGAGVSSTPADGLDLDSNGQQSIGSIRSGIVNLWAQLPTLEVDGFVTVSDDRLSDLTVDFGLVQLDTLAFTGADLEHPATLAFWLIVLGLLLLLFTRYNRKRNQPNKPLPM